MPFPSFVAGCQPRAAVHRGGAPGRPGAAAPRGADPRGPAHRLGGALEPHRVDEIIGHPQPAVPHVPQETRAGGGRGLRGWVHRAPAGGGAPDRECLCLRVVGSGDFPRPRCPKLFSDLAGCARRLCWVHDSCKEQLSSPRAGMQSQPCQILPGRAGTRLVGAQAGAGRPCQTQKAPTVIPRRSFGNISECTGKAPKAPRPLCHQQHHRSPWKRGRMGQ